MLSHLNTGARGAHSIDKTSMVTKLENFLDKVNVFNMFEIQKHQNKIDKKGRYSPFKIQCFTLGLNQNLNLGVLKIAHGSCAEFNGSK